MADKQAAITFPYVYGENVEKEYPGVRTSIEHITPEVAEKMLQTNINNRDLKKSHVALVALQNSEWTLNGATIVFDEDGILRDGQHRLKACVKAGKPIDTLVVRGIKSKAQLTMDTNSPRALRDYVKMAGYPNYTTVSAVGLALYIADTYGLRNYFMSPKGGKATFNSVMSFIDSSYQSRIEPVVPDVRRLQTKYKGINGGVAGILLDAFRGAGEDNYSEFVDQLLGRKAACVAVGLLKQAFEKNTRETIPEKRMKDKKIGAYTIKAWNAYMRGDDIAQLKFNPGGAHPESFPTIFLGYE